MDDICYLDYSEVQRCFHYDFSPEQYRHKDWIKLKAVHISDAIDFCHFMDRKYVKGRASGELPELEVVKLELDLFFKLKNSRRKLAGRN